LGKFHVPEFHYRPSKFSMDHNEIENLAEKFELHRH